MKLYCDTALFAVLVRCLVHTPVCTPMYGLPLSQSDRRILSVFQSVHNEEFHRVKNIPATLTGPMYRSYRGSISRSYDCVVLSPVVRLFRVSVAMFSGDSLQKTLGKYAIDTGYAYVKVELSF